MCEECGCHNLMTTKSATPSALRQAHASFTAKVEVNEPVLAKNIEHAQRNRARFRELGIHVVNLISSPGSGKTTLLETMATLLGPRLAVIVGDLQTERDAVRIRAKGVQAVQIETQGACHLDAESVGKALQQLDLSLVRLLVIENVGNLVCPASYDLGENEKLVLLSTPEGDDKVLKYPSIFSRANLLVITKVDLLGVLDFDPQKAIAECLSLSPKVKSFLVSAKTGQGIAELLSYWE